MNILISVIGSEASDDWISRLLSELKIENCAITYRDKKTAQNSRTKQYATHQFFHKKMKEGDYSDFDDLMSEAPPVDVELLNEMAPYESQIFWMMERCESVDFNTRWEHYISHLRFWNYILCKLQINIYFSITTTHEVYDYVIYNLCKIKGIKYISGFGLSYYDRYHLLEDIHNPLPMLPSEFDNLVEKYKDVGINDIVLRSDVEEMYNFYTGEGDRTPYYMKTAKNRFKKHIFNLLYNNLSVARFVANVILKQGNNMLARYFLYLLYRSVFVFGSIVRFLSFSENTYKWFTEKKYLTKVFNEADIALNYYKNNTSSVDYSKKYIYVALHMQPENTSSPLGGVYVDQALMIEMLSYYAPTGWIVYIKENPKQLQQDFTIDIRMKKSSLYRTIHFYERINKCKNVRLVSLKEDTYKLMDNAMAVATLTGTVGLEAITKGIPCLMFGYSYMQYAPNVYHIQNNDDCKKAIEYIQKDNRVDEFYFKKIKLYFKALEKYVFVATPEVQLLSDDEIEESKDTLVRKFREKIVSISQTGS